MQKRRKREETALLDLSGLMDIIFILLIFVMLSVSFQQKFSVMELDIPSAVTSQAGKEADLEISVLSNSSLWIEQTEIPFESLTSEIQKRSPSRIRLNAEKNLRYEDFIRISEKIKSTGIEKLDLGLKQ
jgi:biopolymer transport protein ExbD